MRKWITFIVAGATAFFFIQILGWVGASTKMLITGELKAMEELIGGSCKESTNLVVWIADYLYSMNDTAKFFDADGYVRLITIRLLLPLTSLCWFFMIYVAAFLIIWPLARASNGWYFEELFVVKAVNFISLRWSILLLLILSTQMFYTAIPAILFIEFLLITKLSMLFANSQMIMRFYNRRMLD